MIQPSLTGLVHALFATQHCVLGYYQAVPAGLYATNSCHSSELERNVHRTERLWVRSCHDSAATMRPGVLRQNLENVETPGVRPLGRI